jgi:hypothetical protein
MTDHCLGDVDFLQDRHGTLLDWTFDIDLYKFQQDFQAQ